MRGYLLSRAQWQRDKVGPAFGKSTFLRNILTSEAPLHAGRFIASALAILNELNYPYTDIRI